MAQLAQPNFSTLLNKPMSEVERPKPLPQGSYICVVKGLPKFDKSTKKGTDYVEFTLQPIQAGEDVDEDALKEMGGLGDKLIYDTYYLTDKSLYRLKDFLENCGIEDDVSVQEAIEQTPNKNVGVNIKHVASDDGQMIYANVGSTFAVE